MKPSRQIGPVVLVMITGVTIMLVSRTMRLPNTDGLAQPASDRSSVGQYDDVIVGTKVPTEAWVAYESHVLATMTAQAVKINSRRVPVQLAATETPAFPVPLSEEHAIQLALRQVPEASSARDRVARLITQKTLKTSIGWGTSNGDPEDLAWLVAFRTAEGQAPYPGLPADADPRRPFVPPTTAGYIVAISINGNTLARGTLLDEASGSNLRFSAISALKDESNAGGSKREVVAALARPSPTAKSLQFSYDDIQLEIQSVLASLDVPVAAGNVVAAEMTLLEWEQLKSQHSHYAYEDTQSDQVLAIMNATNVWVVAFETLDSLERSQVWMGSVDADDLHQLDAEATEMGQNRFHNPATGVAIGVAVFDAETGELLENGVFNDSPDAVRPPNLDVYAAIDSLDSRN